MAGKLSCNGQVNKGERRAAAQRRQDAPVFGAGNLPAPDLTQSAAETASGPSEEDMRDFCAKGLVRVHVKDAAMAVQQSSPEVRAASVL